ncbi:helix-turn-helix domain-containing protein [Actinomycetospora soli]|uniref:helix-turn-helix domain-containing protein n=1 Tax=Actinomycetospora soli TaxID=2893887 RepID=UPI001E4D98E3|nr:AraC family transcriptional regulator [Actinomycetospora soli]MCD2186487.1 AraC family transcriptional regulator [Actinomycetospora soli]
MFRLARVPATLRGTVRRLVAFDEGSEVVVRRRQAPTSTCTLVVGLADPLRVDGVEHAAFVTGLTVASAITEFAGHQAGVQADLTPVGALRLFGVALEGLVGLDALGPDLARLPDRLADLPSWSARLATVVAVLERRLATTGRIPDPEVARAWARLEHSAGRHPVAALADDVGWSRRHLTRRFTAQIGLSPTTAGRVLRFRRAADLLVPPVGAGGSTVRIADVAAACGFADHAHLDREFAALAGCSPTEYRAGWSTVAVDPADVVHG